MAAEVLVSRVSLGAVLGTNGGLVTSRVSLGAVLGLKTSTDIAVSRVSIGFVVNTDPTLGGTIPRRAAQIIG